MLHEQRLFFLASKAIAFALSRVYGRSPFTGYLTNVINPTTTRCTVTVRATAGGGAAGLTGAAGPALLAGCAATYSAGPSAIATATAAASQTTLAAAHAASGGTPWRLVEHTHSHVTAAVAKAAVAAAATDEDHMGGVLYQSGRERTP